MDQKLKEKTKRFISDCKKHGAVMSHDVINIIDQHNMRSDRWHIESISDITHRSEANLMSIRGIGRARLESIKKTLACVGLSLDKVGVDNNPKLTRLIKQELERKNQWIRN